MPAFITGNDTDTNNRNTTVQQPDLVSVQFDDNHNNNMNNNGFLIAIQVIFSLLVFFIFAFCIVTGVRKSKKAKRQRQIMIEHAILQQERRYQLHLQGQCHSSSTITTAHFNDSSLIACPPPSYSPPDPRYSLPQDAVLRLDCLLSQNQICTKPQ